MRPRLDLPQTLLALVERQEVDVAVREGIRPTEIHVSRTLSASLPKLEWV